MGRRSAATVRQRRGWRLVKSGLSLASSYAMTPSLRQGVKRKNAQKFANCIHPPLLSVQGDPEVLDVIPPPELHLLMGAVNIKLELLRMILETIGIEQKLWDWCDSKGVTRRGEKIF